MSRILIVDDAPFIRLMLKDILVKENHVIVAEADTGQEGIELFKKHAPDLVMMDITMPEMNGIEAVKEILSIDQDAKIIMCSAMGQQRRIMEAIESGAKDFIVKPFAENSVIDAVNRVLSL